MCENPGIGYLSDGKKVDSSDYINLGSSDVNTVIEQDSVPAPDPIIGAEETIIFDFTKARLED